jgi:hypothetical protein
MMLRVHGHEVSRRDFLLGSAIAAGSVRLLGQTGALTAQQVADRLRAAGQGAAGRRATVDGIKAGDPAIAVTGIVVTAMATVGMLQRAAEDRRNFVVSYDPVFYTASDEPGPRANDPVYLAKKKLIDDRRLVVYRLFDEWNAQAGPQPASKLAAQLGWKGSTPPADDVYEIPETTLGQIADVKGFPGARLVGDRAWRVRRVSVLPGTTTLAAVMTAFAKADAVVAGEAREWEGVPYVLDAIAAGQQKGLVLLGRIVSGQPGLAACADWIRRTVPDVPVTFAGTSDPYWSAR